MSRDITLEDTIYLLFTSRSFSTGVPTQLAGTPVVSAYENDSATQITAGITLGVDHDSVTGLNLLTIVATSANGYEAGKDYTLVITTGTVGGVSVVGEVVGEFTIGRSAAAVDLANGTDGLGAIKGETAQILADTNELQTDDVPGLIAALNDVSQADITGGAYALDTDANGRVRIVDGTGAGELDTSAGLVQLLAATQASIDAIEADTNELQTDDVPGLIAALNDVSQADITGGAYALDSDANGRVRIVDGTGAGEIDTVSGSVQLLAATQASIDSTEADTNELQGDWTNGGRLDLILDELTVQGDTNETKIDTIDGNVDTIHSFIAQDYDDNFSVDAGDIAKFKMAINAAADWADGGRLDLIIDTIAGDVVNIDGAAMRGTENAALASVCTEGRLAELDAANLPADVDLILADTNELQTDDVPGLIAALNDVSQADITGGAYALDTDANGRVRIVDGTGAGELDTSAGLVQLLAATQASIDAIEADTNELQTDDVPGLIAALNDLAFGDVWTTQMTESYAANGVAPTPAQALFAIHQKLMQFAFSSTASNVYKLDNSTLAFAGTLDDATNPTQDRRQ